MSELILQIIVYSAGAVVMLSTIPQIYKIVKTKQAKGISVTSYILLSISQALWLIYGILKADNKLIITNSILLLLIIIILLLVIYYEKIYTPTRNLNTNNTILNHNY